MRFLFVELPRERLRVREERIEFVKRQGLCLDQQDEIVLLLAQGFSLRRALRAVTTEHWSHLALSSAQRLIGASGADSSDAVSNPYQ
jgi:hypothetical protein